MYTNYVAAFLRKVGSKYLKIKKPLKGGEKAT